MCFAHGSLYLVLIFESIVLGPLLRNLIFYGMKLGLSGVDLSQNPENVIESFVIALVVTLIQFLVCVSIARSLCSKRGAWLAPYFIWKPICLAALAGLLAVLFFEEKLHLITGESEVHDESINRLDKLIFLNHASGFVFNTYGRNMEWLDFRNTVLIPPIATGLAVGLWSLGVAVAAAVLYRQESRHKVRPAQSVDLEEEQLAYRQYQMASLNGHSRTPSTANGKANYKRA